MINSPVLLNDAQVIDFIISGYMVLEPDLPAGLNEQIYNDLEAIGDEVSGRHDAILEMVPRLNQVWDHPQVQGALASLVGEDYTMHSHRHCHKNQPGTRSQTWHQDSVNLRHHHVQRVLGMYYPQDVTPDMGPTALMPGTHYRNAPSDRMATYGNFRDQVVATVKAGSVVVVHYDIWHAATANTGSKVRYMLKFLFDRVSEPTAPSWDHDPTQAEELLKRFMFEKVTDLAQSDGYKERWLRQEMWDHMAGLKNAGIGSQN